jgi:glutaconate CoA-transferase subunit A
MTEAVALIQDGDSIAIGGARVKRHPMALIFEIIRQGKKDLAVFGWDNDIDLDLLVGAHCVKSINTATIAETVPVLNHNLNRAIEANAVRVNTHSEAVAINAFRAGSLGWTFFPARLPVGPEEGWYNENFPQMDCPFTKEKFYLLPSFKPDVAIIHAHVADRAGNVQLDPKREFDSEVDTLIAKSADKVIVTVEQVVSEEFIKRNPQGTILSEEFCDMIVEAPFGVHPTACEGRYEHDIEFLDQYDQISTQSESFHKWMENYIFGVRDHFGYLELVGLEKLFAIEQPRQTV